MGWEARCTVNVFVCVLTDLSGWWREVYTDCFKKQTQTRYTEAGLCSSTWASIHKLTLKYNTKKRAKKQVYSILACKAWAVLAAFHGNWWKGQCDGRTNKGSCRFRSPNVAMQRLASHSSYSEEPTLDSPPKFWYPEIFVVHLSASRQSLKYILKYATADFWTSLHRQICLTNRHINIILRHIGCPRL